MSRDAVALIGFIAMFVLMGLRVPIGISMGLVGVGGFAALSGITPALNLPPLRCRKLRSALSQRGWHEYGR